MSKSTNPVNRNPKVTTNNLIVQNDKKTNKIQQEKATPSYFSHIKKNKVKVVRASMLILLLAAIATIIILAATGKLSSLDKLLPKGLEGATDILCYAGSLFTFVEAGLLAKGLFKLHKDAKKAAKGELQNPGLKTLQVTVEALRKEVEKLKKSNSLPNS